MHKGKYVFSQISIRESLRDVVLTTQAHASKAYHLGFGKHAAKSTLENANTKRDYRIFEEFAYKVIAEAQRCRIVDIFKLNGNVYAFDSTTVDLCLSTFEWALFRKRKGGIKMHTLYDLETQIPPFFHITPAKVHDTKAMDVIPYAGVKPTPSHLHFYNILSGCLIIGNYTHYNNKSLYLLNVVDIISNKYDKYNPPL